jgi:predicted DNA binding protein
MVYLRVVQQNGRSHIRAQVVSRDALCNYRDCCERRGLTFTLERLYQEDSDNDTLRYGLTERQREALVLAHRQGYFGATRETDLQGVADELDISRQALADRLQRGHEHLIANTLR